MSIARPCYCTREQVSRSLDIKETARAHAQIDRLMQSAAESIEGMLHRRLYPWQGTRTKDWPDSQSPTPWRLWLDDKELISVSSLMSGGTSISASGYLLRPDTGPPYNRIEINLGTSAAFSSSSTHQRAVSITGLWGHTNETESAGVLAEALDDSETAVNVSDGSVVGVGDLIAVNSERMLVTGRSWLDSVQDLQAPLTASAANTTVAVSTGSVFAPDEMILLDSERMLVVDVAGNNLTVKRAWDGSALAAHTAPDVYVSRTLTVQRGRLGTTATTHSDATAISRWIPPHLINQLAIAETLNALQQEGSAYARVVGTGETAIEARGVGLADIRDKACTAYGRKARTRVV